MMVVREVQTASPAETEALGEHLGRTAEGGEVVGAIDFQSERASAFDLDDVAVAETLAEFLVVALRNARLLTEARARGV